MQKRTKNAQGGSKANKLKSNSSSSANMSDEVVCDNIINAETHCSDF